MISFSVLAFRHTGGRRYPGPPKHALKLVTSMATEHGFRPHIKFGAGFHRNDEGVTTEIPVTRVIKFAQAAKAFKVNSPKT